MNSEPESWMSDVDIEVETKPPTVFLVFRGPGGKRMRLKIPLDKAKELHKGLGYAIRAANLESN